MWFWYVYTLSYKLFSDLVAGVSWAALRSAPFTTTHTIVCSNKLLRRRATGADGRNPNAGRTGTPSPARGGPARALD